MPMTYIFLPPLRTPSGGQAVLHQVAAHLHTARRAVTLVPREADFWCPDESRDVPVCPWGELRLTPEDLWLVPEGWVNALTPGLKAGARSLLYVQSWAHLFSALPEGVLWNQLAVDFLAVSDPVAWYLKTSLGVDAPILRPGIDLERFHTAERGQASPVRVAFMPRKNKALTAQIRAVFESRAARDPQAPKVLWEPIEGQTPEGVAEIMRRSHIYLSTSFPEGFSLPPLEAMASGCLSVGFSGMGGFDYMRQAQDWEGAARPWFPLREVPFGGNGLWAADADVAAAALSLERAVRWVAFGDERYTQTVEAALATAQHYSTGRQAEAVLGVWDGLGF